MNKLNKIIIVLASAAVLSPVNAWFEPTGLTPVQELQVNQNIRSHLRINTLTSQVRSLSTRLQELQSKQLYANNERNASVDAEIAKRIAKRVMYENNLRNSNAGNIGQVVK